MAPDLQRALKQVPKNVDFLLIDLPPGVHAITGCVLSTVPDAQVLAPVRLGQLDVTALVVLFDLVDEARATNSVQILGIIPSEVDRSHASTRALTSLREEYPGKLLPGIRRTAEIALDEVDHDRLADPAARSCGARDFAKLTDAILRAAGLSRSRSLPA